MKTKSTSLLSTSTFALCGIVMLATQGLAADKDTLVAADVKFIKHEAAAGMGLVKIAGFGVKKTERADIKAFAEMLVTEHTKSNEELAKLAATKGVELSTVIDPEQAETYQKLEKQSGTDFDKEFLATIVSGHKKCVSNFEEASQEAKDNDLKVWADKMLPTLKTHLAKARELSSNSTVSAANQPDNTKRNMRDSNAATLTPLDQGNNQADIDTTAQIRKEIIAGENMSVNAQNVKIITNAGKVTLRGPVNTAEEKRLIGQIANRIARAENVVNQLEVQIKTTSN